MEEKKSRKAFTLIEGGGQFADVPSAPWWTSHRYMLEQCVNGPKVVLRRGWVTKEDSIGLIKMIDMASGKSGPGVRPSREY